MPAKWGRGLFLFGVFLTSGIIARYCVGARWPTGELFMQNITLWWACPWTLSVAAVQAGGLGMVALGRTQMVAPRVSAQRQEADGAALWLCVVGLLGVFAVGCPGYFVLMPSGRPTTRLSPSERTPGCLARGCSSPSIWAA